MVCASVVSASGRDSVPSMQTIEHVTRTGHHYVYRFPLTSTGVAAVVRAVRRQVGDRTLDIDFADLSRVFDLLEEKTSVTTCGLPQAKKET